MRFDLCQSMIVDQRPDRGVLFKAVANAKSSRVRGELFSKFVIDAFLDVQPIGGHAGLPSIAKLGSDRAVNGGVDISIVEDDERGVPAEFEADALDLVGALAHQ